MITVEKVKKAIYRFGYYPALIFLKEQEDLENFKKCKIIKEALDQVGKGRGWYLSSKVDKVSLDKTYENIINSRKDPTTINNNMPSYIEEFKILMNSK